MTDRIARSPRNYQACSPLPTDVLPNIMLRVENRDDFSRLACTCRGFYAWSAPWLTSRRQAAELNRDPQRLIKVPAWIKTNSRHLHPADWDALQLWDNAGEHRSKVDMWIRSVGFDYTASLQPGPAPSATASNAAHLDFILFSPRLLPDVNEEAASRANERLAANADFALSGFKPSGEAWECDVLAGAVAWLKQNAATISIDARTSSVKGLTWAMKSVMVARRSPSLAFHLLEHELSKSHCVSNYGPSKTRWEDPLLTALVLAARNCALEAGSQEASSFLCAIHQAISCLARMNESAALSVLVEHLDDVMELMAEDTWTPGSAESAWLCALVQAIRDMPEALATIRETLIERDFITADGWDALLLSVRLTPSQEPG
jgi:hypothetical protein